MTLTEIKRELAARGMRPLARFGQNFLHDQNAARAVVADALAGQPAGSTVLEVGPGLGALTGLLLEAGCPVTALEIDRGLAAFLRERFAAAPGFTLREGDALRLLPETAAPQLVAGNLPYYISGPLLAGFLAFSPPPRRMVLTLQKEVAERLAAKPGTEAYGALTVQVQSAYAARLSRVLPPSVFYPQPEVDSAVVVLDLLPAPHLPEGERAAFLAFVKKGFSQRRKKLSNTLGVPEDRRPDALSVAEWVALWRRFGAAAGS
ncbi:MAG: 16S rRNA (adenine(1518)-N(6)/adenine(1519)-N(6))-dimethyltransferase RsmA [Verrucomicrobium sp.]|nr:16S rRNA (adenine(1518)-N(6)/adenine(1519)-N(6))-dimethyltransferase RsmA [Verrucomicrobium sp.]